MMKLFYYIFLFLVINTTDGRWNIQRFLPLKRFKQQQQENGRWHSRLLGKFKAVRRKRQESIERSTWKARIQHCLRPRMSITVKEKKKMMMMKCEKRLPVKESKQTKVPSTDIKNGQAKTQKQQRLKVPKKQRRKANETDCSSFKQTRSIWKRYRDSKNADTAYRMCVLSSLAYWEFDKQQQHYPNMTSFRLQSDIPAQSTRSIRQSTKVALCHVASGISNSHNIIERHQQQQNNNNTSLQQQSCRSVVSRQANSGLEYDFQWYLYDWHEPTPLAGKWHDTDLLVATSGDDILTLNFAGTASAADAMTNVQTFEKIGHSKLFNNITAGSIHRGFLNAYSRVERGKVVRIASFRDEQYNTLTSSLHQRYRDCYVDDGNAAAIASNEESSSSKNKTASGKEKKVKRPKCRGRDEKLMNILRELVTKALLAGHKVHLSGHSLGGGLATLMALDVILNFPAVPIKRLHLWTYGAPEIGDDIFLQSAMNASPRLKAFIQNNGKRRYHRYVTLSDKCKADVVSTIASKALPSHKRGLHGRIVRKLGGVRGRLVHIAEPHYLPPLVLPKTNGTNVNSEDDVPTKTGSALGAHLTTSYLQGISRESPSHPLMSNLPLEVAEFVGEIPPQQKVATAAAS